MRTRRENYSHSNALYQYRYKQPLGEATPGTLEFFLAERYVLFSQCGSKVLAGRIHHKPYELFSADLLAFDCKPLEWDELGLVTRPPDHIMMSPGVDVDTFLLSETP